MKEFLFIGSSWPRQRQAAGQAGFTLLEVLLVLFVLGLMAAMVLPAIGGLDNRARAEITRANMALLRNAIVGPADRFDAEGRPLVGGYVGDLHRWPDLWEPRAEIKPTFTGSDWETPTTMTAGLGQGPDYFMNANLVFFRPSGSFRAKRWHWDRPYRRLYNDTTNNADHIGGLETENEGQPRGLWTRYPEDLPFDIGAGASLHRAPGLDLGPNWKGPYINPPLDGLLADADHLATSDADYAALEPRWHSSGAHANNETWEDGDYTPAGEAGEFFDDKEAFRLLHSDGRFVDGWGRALRFFITADPDAAGETLFWILSEGPDRMGEYPNKTSATDIMGSDYASTGQGYSPEAAVNQDNIVMKLSSRDWRALLAQENRRKSEATAALLQRLRQALIGAAPTGFNSGFTAHLERWPRLFRWESAASDWDDQEGATAYSVGQPRELWTATPTADLSDDLAPQGWGLGWQRAYLDAPAGAGADQQLRDAWGRELLLFHDTGNNALLLLSRGADGLYAFGSTVDGAGQEPANVTEAFDLDAYDPVTPSNQDNVVLRLDAVLWRPGYFLLPRVTLFNIDPATCRATFHRSAALVDGVDRLKAGVDGVVTDADGDGAADDWVIGDGTAVNPAFACSDLSSHQGASGARYLLLWHDADDNGELDSGEPCQALIYPLLPLAGTGVQPELTLDASVDFHAAP